MVSFLGHLAMAVALVTAIVGFAGLAIGPRLGAYRTVTMLTGSMAPTYPVGSILVDRPQPTSELRVGQVLTYAIPVDDHRVVSHRVISVEPDPKGGYIVRTKGDANNGPDPWVARIADDTVWTAHMVFPHIGSAILALRNPALLPYVLYLLPGLCALWTLMGVWRDT